MAKSKEQKQLEAQKRLRLTLPQLRDRYLRTQYGTLEYSRFAQEHGQEAADIRAREAREQYAQVCTEAHVDPYGNPLK